jgi:hypothetical protein
VSGTKYLSRIRATSALAMVNARTVRRALVVFVMLGSLSTACNPGSPGVLSEVDQAKYDAAHLPAGRSIYWIGEKYGLNRPLGSARRGKETWWEGLSQSYPVAGGQPAINIATYSDASEVAAERKHWARDLRKAGARLILRAKQPGGEIVMVWIGDYPNAPAEDATVAAEIRRKLQPVPRRAE